jgi:amino acid transporter
LATVLYTDAVVSPGGSAYVGVALDARHTYALGKNGLLPRALMRVDPRRGIPQRALLLNLAVMTLFLLPFGGWQHIVAVMGDLYLLGYAASVVAAAILRPGRRYLAPAGFVISTEFIYWSGWHDLRIALPLVLAAVPLFPILSRPDDGATSVRAEFRRGAWLPVYLVFLFAVSWAGTFGGRALLRAPADSLVVALGAALVFRWATRAVMVGRTVEP